MKTRVARDGATEAEKIPDYADIGHDKEFVFTLETMFYTNVYKLSFHSTPPLANY